MDNTSRAVDTYRRKNILMLATLMATATYAAGLTPPGGIWQDTMGHLPGDPIMLSTNHRRYLAFFYLNAAAFALSLMVVVLSLVLTACPRKREPRFDLPLRLLMLAATLAFLVAYGNGACRDKFRTIVFSVLVSINFLNTLFYAPLLFKLDDSSNSVETDVQKHHRKLIAPLSMFMLTISYVAGLSTPGGFWDSAGAGHSPGDAILHGKLLHLFSYFNIGQFASSLHGVFMVMCGGQLHVGFFSFTMISGVLGLIVAYTVGSTRGRHTTVGVICGMCVAVVAYVVLYVVVMKAIRDTSLWKKLQHLLGPGRKQDEIAEADRVHAITERQLCRASSLVQLLSGLAVSITYQAGLYPPGGVWQDGHKLAGDPILQTTNPARYKAFFFCNSVAFVASLLAIFLGQKSYLIESHALQAAMILDLLGLIVTYAIGTCRDQISSMYAVGIAGAAVVYVVVHVQYFTLGSVDNNENNAKRVDDERVDKKGRRFLLFAILIASITYQAGLTPPGGFLLQDDSQTGHRAGDPILLVNYPHRYKAFFYCNSVSFMLSTVQVLLLVNPSLFRPAIRSRALSLCSAVSFVCLIGAFGAGSTQHLKTSIYIFVLGSVASVLCLPLLLWIYFAEQEQRPCMESSNGNPPIPTPTPTEQQRPCTESSDGNPPTPTTTPTEQQRPCTESSNNNPPTPTPTEQQRPCTESSDDNPSSSMATTKEDRSTMRKRIYLMTLATLLGGVTYQAGLDPPGGSWQSTSNGHVAGNPVMHDDRRARYLTFLYGNSTTFVASIYLIELLLFSKFGCCKGKNLNMAIDATVSLQYLGFLVAYAAGSSRQWKTSAHVGTLVVAVLVYVATHVMLSRWRRKLNESSAQHPVDG